MNPMRVPLLALLPPLLASCSRYGLESDMSGLRADIEKLQRDVPPDAPLWIADGDNAFARHLEDGTPRVPDFIYNHILAKLAKAADADLDAQAKGDFDLDACRRDPD